MRLGPLDIVSEATETGGNINVTGQDWATGQLSDVKSNSEVSQRLLSQNTSIQWRSTNISSHDKWVCVSRWRHNSLVGTHLIVSYLHINWQVGLCQCQTSYSSDARSWILSAPTEAVAGAAGGPPFWLTLQRSERAKTWRTMPNKHRNQHGKYSNEKWLIPLTTRLWNVWLLVVGGSYFEWVQLNPQLYQVRIMKRMI